MEHLPVARNYGAGVCVVVILSTAACLQAQGRSAASVLLSARAGVNAEAMDPGSGTSAGVGGAVEIHISRSWGIEFEAWVPAFISGEVPTRDTALSPTPSVGHFRTLLFGVNAVRHFGNAGARPYVLGGLVVARTQIRPEYADPWQMGDAYLQGGFGVMIPLSPRLSLAPEVRLATVLMATSLRAGVAVVYRAR